MRRGPPHALLLLLPIAIAAAAGCRRAPPAHRDVAPADAAPADAALSPEAAPADGGDGAAAAAADCPAEASAPTPLPGVPENRRTAAYWIERSAERADDPLLSPAEIESHVAALERPVDGEPLVRADLRSPMDPAQTLAEVNGRLAQMRARAASGEYVRDGGDRLDPAPFAAVAALPEDRHDLRVVLADVELLCGPLAGAIRSTTRDADIDRNGCSRIRAQEPVELLAEWPGDLLLVRTRHTLGWIPAVAPLSPPVPDRLRTPIVAGPHVFPDRDVAIGAPGIEPVPIPSGTRLALAPGTTDRVLLAHAAGITPSDPAEASLHATERPLTRRALLETAFARLDVPYGWADADGGLDCSGFVLEVLGAFGLALPRHSARQALAGSFSIDVGGLGRDAARKQRLLDAADRRGIVLLQMPGHIALYLGRDGDGIPMALHAFREYLEPCPGGGETHRKVDRVEVSPLSLGEGGSKGSLIDRLDRITVFGGPPGPELEGAARRRAAAPFRIPGPREPCDDTVDVAIFRSPRRPHPGKPLRVIVVGRADPGPAAITLRDPEGRLHAPPMHRLGGPPYGWWVEIASPAPGEWTAAMGDGDRLDTCERFTVARYPVKPPPRRAGDPTWRPIVAWERDTEALYAAFVEQLFGDPVDEDVTWPGLQAVLRDPARNLLHDHLGLDEDERLNLEPDCADLPYFLRAYFAWKLRLPYSFRRCNRGAAGRPPACTEAPKNNLLPPEALRADAAGTPEMIEEPPPTPEPLPPAEGDEVDAFAEFVWRVGCTVHSASGRTAPGDDRTDLYPVPLEREWLTPGTVFADPYGHLLVVAAWIPQGTDRYGVLLGVDAQPDGTVGRRRFWRGSFLFSPDTTDVGAGFKAFRPPEYDRRDETLVLPDNAALGPSADHPPWSDQQYRITSDDFYDRMESLINPRPLDPDELLGSLVDALAESAARRVVSVDNGERFVTARDRPPVEMPEGYAVFETGGAWEDYATPSRDMRLLISIDAVSGFPASIARSPERFGLDPASARAAAAAAAADLPQRLAERRFSYTRTDGSTRELTLADLVSRGEAFEVAYNPNDCVEIRWGAPPGSDEISTCRRRAPPEQQARMESYRPWFHTRRRPAR